MTEAGASGSLAFCFSFLEGFFEVAACSMSLGLAIAPRSFISFTVAYVCSVCFAFFLPFFVSLVASPTTSTFASSN
jgi:hypothetical protein